jgi:hypothetical protein
MAENAMKDHLLLLSLLLKFNLANDHQVLVSQIENIFNTQLLGNDKAFEGIPEEHVLNLLIQYAHDIDICSEGKATMDHFQKFIHKHHITEKLSTRCLAYLSSLCIRKDFAERDSIQEQISRSLHLKLESM